MAKIRLGIVSMTDSFDKLADICINNNLGGQTVDYLVDIKKTLEEKEKLEQALYKAIGIIRDLNDCTNIDYPTCPFRKECEKGIIDSCLCTEEYWKKYLMEL